MDPESQTENSNAVTSVTSDYADIHQQDRRKICCNCDRPVNVCLCSIIPSKPIVTVNTRIIILHHPHEQRHKLATVPVLSKCLRNCDIIVGRRLRYGDSNVLDSLHDDTLRNPNFTTRAIYLFPGSDTSSQEINHWKSSKHSVETSNYVLIAFDGTWKHAREMMRASLSFLSKFAVQVHLDYDVGNDGRSIFNSDLILRKEPFSGCMSTMEAISHCLRILEPNGIDIESSLIEVLRSMVKFQASFLKPMKPRPKLIKAGREGKI